jgi:hypothetical protein
MEQRTSSSSELVDLDGEEVHVHTWMPSTSHEEPRGLAVVFHGFLVRSVTGCTLPLLVEGFFSLSIVAGSADWPLFRSSFLPPDTRSSLILSSNLRV